MSALPKIEQEFFPLQGGLDLMTPAIALDPGKTFDAQNYEPEITGGYRRTDGYERYDGHQSPSSANYWILPYTLTTTPFVAGNTVTGSTSGATAVILAVESNVPGEAYPNFLVIGRLIGNFIQGEFIY